MLLPKRQPPIAFQPCFVPAPSWLDTPHRQALEVPLGVIAPAMTRWPSLNPVTAALSFAITPTGSCPMVRPLATGYSPFRMWMSVPQIVAVVIFSTASSGPGAGMDFSSSTMRPASTKIAALIFGITVRSTEWPVEAARTEGGTP
jgi:hypothetical protein